MELVNTHSITREALSEKGARWLRKQILLGGYPMGYHLSEAQLAEQLGVSRGSVRGAIQLLESEGLVHTRSNGRTMTAGFSRKDLHDLFRVRLLLEAEAIRTIVADEGEKDFSRLDSLIQMLKEERDHAALINLDIEFHYTLVELAQNRVLITLWSVLRGLISTLIEISSDFYEQLKLVTDVHEQIIQAVKNGQAEQAITLLSEHLTLGEEIISSHLANG